MARIVKESNIDIDWRIDEEHLAVPFMEMCDCEAICYILNNALGERSHILYKAVPAGYVLYKRTCA